LVAEAPDEPTYCEFKKVLSYSTKKEKGELVKDVSSFANADLEALGGYGYIVFGVSNDGHVVGIEDLAGDPPSAIRQVVNGYLDRPVVFEYVTCEVDDKSGGSQRVAAIIVPDSRRRPHVVSKEIKERRSNRDVFWLREREVWIRKTGGRELATAEDFDTMYEGKLSRLVDNLVRPLRERVERLESDLREQRSTVPELGFGMFDLSSSGPLPSGRPHAILGNLIDVGGVRDQIELARKQARIKTSKAEPWRARPSIEPTADDYENYALDLEAWLSELGNILFVEFMLVNTGRVPAEDVEVVLEVPAQLRPREALPKRPEKPLSIMQRYSQAMGTRTRYVVSKQNSPDSLIGPVISDADKLGMAQAVWEVGKLYHDRPLFTDSEENDIDGLLISSENYKYLLSQAGGKVQLEYALRAANMPEKVRGVLSLT
jgi:hypothetical protein